MDGWVGRCKSEWVCEWISDRCRAARNDVQWNLYLNEHHNNKISAWHFPFCAQQLTIYFSVAQQLLADLVLFIIEASLSHSDTPHSIDRSDWCTNLSLTTNNTHKRQISISPVGCKPTIPASKRLQIWILNNYIRLCKNATYQRNHTRDTVYLL